MQQKRLINSSSQLNMFRAIILPIFMSTRLCVTACGFIIPQAVTHSLVLLKMGKIISRNMLS